MLPCAYRLPQRWRHIVENLSFTGASWHKQRMQALMEEARIERFLQQKRRRDAQEWSQRQHWRNRKSN